MVIIIVTIFSGCSSQNINDTNKIQICDYTAVGEDITEQFKNSSEKLLLAESSKYRLMIDKNGVIKVVDENDFVYWSTALNSFEDIPNDEALSSTVIKYNINNGDKTMDSYSESFDKEQFKLYRDGDAIVYEQIMGDFVTDLLIPEALSEKRFAEITAKMSQKESSYISRQYELYTPDTATKDILEKVPGLKKGSYYVLMSDNSYAQQSRIHSAFENSNYSKDDLAADRNDAGISSNNQGEVFKIVIKFVLENDGLVVEVPCDQIYYPDNSNLTSIDLFKYGFFGAESSEGAYVVPSGSGALFDFSANKKVEYSLQFDGKDYSNVNVKENVDYSGHPLFGTIYQDAACVAIVEEGSEIVRLQIESVEGGYIQYPRLMLTPWQKSSSARDYVAYAEDSYSGNVRIRYSFLEGERANYSQMSAVYGEYLEKTGAFDNKSVTDNIPFEMEVINSLYVKESVAGISTTTEKVVTSFDETKDMVNWFYENNIDNIWLKLNGANKRGLFAQQPGEFSISKKAGGNVGYENLKTYCVETQSQMFLNVNIPFYYADKLGDNYHANKDTTRQLNQKKVQVYVNEKSTLEKRNDLPILDVVSPSKYFVYAKKYTENTTTLGQGLSVGELASILNSNFVQGNYISRSQTKNIVKDSLEYLNNSYNLLAENPSAYTLNYIYGFEKLPLKNDYEIFEYDIPLIPIAIHGKISYTSTYWNDQPNMQQARLKAIEYGSGIAYRFAANITKETTTGQNSFLYNVDYNLWRETALENYQYVSKALNGLNDVPIIEHTYISETLVKVSYEDGSIIYLNYNDEQVELDGIVVDAYSYLRK